MAIAIRRKDSGSRGLNLLIRSAIFGMFLGQAGWIDQQVLLVGKDGEPVPGEGDLVGVFRIGEARGSFG